MPQPDDVDQLSLAEPMRSRWSPSVFDDQHALSDAELATLLHAAQWAPSWGDLQPWAFVVVRRGGQAHQALVPRLRPGNSTWVPRAAVVLITAAQVAPGPGGEDIKDEGASHYDLGQAAAHLTLQATAMGLQAHQFGGFDREGVADDLAVPAHFRVMSGIAIGRRGDPAEASERDRDREERTRVRKSLPELVHREGWHQPWPGASS